MRDKYTPTKEEQAILDAKPQYTLWFAKQVITGGDIHDCRSFWRDVFPWIKTRGRIDDLEIFGGPIINFAGFLGEFPMSDGKGGFVEGKREVGPFIEAKEPELFGFLVADFFEYMRLKYGVVPVWRKEKKSKSK